MDYKEKYEMALERARIWKDKSGMPKDKQGILDDIFPELKESEDERIRKELVNYFTEGREFLSLCSFGRDKILAWLEKQAEIEKISNDDLATLENWEDIIKENKEKWQLSDWFIEATSLLIQKVKRIENNHKSKFNIGDGLEKQGEQKPTDTDNKFIRMRETKPKDISEFLDRLTTVEQEFLWEHIAKIRELDKEKQKTTWSEEDEEQVSIITNIVKAHCGKLIDCRSNLSWLESLKNRVIPQPKEWSEEDEEKAAKLKEFITQCKGFNKANREKAFNMIDALKPKSHWKPSKEQIIALRWVLNNIPYNKYKEEISGLLDQIKDL